MSAFWTTPGLEPKRNFKFIMSITGGDGEIKEFLIQKTARPSLETTATEHTFLNHFFYFPGKTKWNAVEVTCVDVVKPANLNMTSEIMKMIQGSGYKRPTAIDSQNRLNLNTTFKDAGTSALGGVEIKATDSVGRVVDSWKLHGAWLQKIAFSEYDYGNEDLSTCTMTIQYDFAVFKDSTGQEIPATS